MLLKVPVVAVSFLKHWKLDFRAMGGSDVLELTQVRLKRLLVVSSFNGGWVVRLKLHFLLIRLRNPDSILGEPRDRMMDDLWLPSHLITFVEGIEVVNRQDMVSQALWVLSLAFQSLVHYFVVQALLVHNLDC